MLTLFWLLKRKAFFISIYFRKMTPIFELSTKWGMSIPLYVSICKQNYFYLAFTFYSSQLSWLVNLNAIVLSWSILLLGPDVYFLRKSSTLYPLPITPLWKSFWCLSILQKQKHMSLCKVIRFSLFMQSQHRYLHSRLKTVCLNLVSC